MPDEPLRSRRRECPGRCRVPFGCVLNVRVLADWLHGPVVAAGDGSPARMRRELRAAGSSLPMRRRIRLSARMGRLCEGSAKCRRWLSIEVNRGPGCTPIMIDMSLTPVAVESLFVQAVS